MTGALLLARKDVRTLFRSWVLVLALVAYPIAISLLVGQMLEGATSSMSIAFVNEDRTGKELRVGDERFGLAEYRTEATQSGVLVLDMQRGEAFRALRGGQVNGVLLIPNGTFAKLSTLLAPAQVELYTSPDELGAVVAQRISGSIYDLNLEISRAFVETNAEYLKTLVDGGRVEVLDRTYDALGLQPSVRELQRIERYVTNPDALDTIDRVIAFAKDAQIAIGLADQALDATAAPVRLKESREKGESSSLTARALSIGLGVVLAFVCVLLVATSLAAEREDRVLGRLLAGIASAWQIVISKLLVGALLSAALGLGLFASVATMVDQPWSRLPHLVLALSIAALAFGGIGAVVATIVSDARSATLVAILLVLPMIVVGLIPSTPLGDAISLPLPFVHAQELFNAVLFERHPWPTVAREASALLAIAAICTATSRALLKRFA